MLLSQLFWSILFSFTLNTVSQLGIRAVIGEWICTNSDIFTCSSGWLSVCVTVWSQQQSTFCKILLWVSNEVTFPSFSSASSLDDIVPVDDVRAILVMSPRINVQFQYDLSHIRTLKYTYMHGNKTELFLYWIRALCYPSDVNQTRIFPNCSASRIIWRTLF